MRRRVPHGGARRAIVRTHRGRLFHDPWHAAASASRSASRTRAARQHDQDRADRLDRHGQVDRREDVRARRASRCSTPTRWCASCGPGGALVDAIGARFPGTVEVAMLDRDGLAQAVVDDPSELAALEAIVHPAVRGAREAFIDEQSLAQRPWCSKFPSCSKPAARRSSTRSSWSPRRPTFSARESWRDPE